MSEETDELGTGTGDSGYGTAALTQSAGESLSQSQPQDDTTETTTQTPPQPDSQATESTPETTSATEGDSGTSDRFMEPFDWSEQSKDVLQDSKASGIEYTPEVKLENGYEYIMGRSTPVTAGLENTGARVRPELEAAITDAINDVKRFYSGDKCYDADYYEAALTVALWHHDEVLAVMSELGYGAKQ